MILTTAVQAYVATPEAPGRGRVAAPLSDLDHYNVKRLAERGEAALRLVYSVLNHTIRGKAQTRPNRRISTVEDLLSRC